MRHAGRTTRRPGRRRNLTLETRDRLGGDSLGARPALAEHGVDFRLETTGFYQGMVEGDGNHDMEFSGRTDLFLALDGHKAGLWPGFFVNIHGGYRYGDLPAKGGTLSLLRMER